jgi:dolichyl-phosphate-mannose--protein O-mannosyl transferase
MVTAVCAEVFDYHSFLLAVPVYVGMFMAVYGMVAHLRERQEGMAAVFITAVFFFSWIPYVFLSRVTFIYHFYVAMPFLCLATAYLISKYWNTKVGKIVAIALFAGVIILFIVFYPVISGAPAPTSWLDKLKLFPSWYF